MTRSALFELASAGQAEFVCAAFDETTVQV